MAFGATAKHAKARKTVDTVQRTVKWLASFGVTDHWMVSCYLKLEPRDRTRGKYLIKLKNRTKARLAWLEAHGCGDAERKAVERDLERVRAHLEHADNLPTGHGVAIFACEPLKLFEAIPLPRVFRSRLAIDRSPLLRELAALNDEFGRVLCAVYDRTSARFFSVTASGIEELSSLDAGDTTRPSRFRGRGAVSGATAGEHNYHQRIREEKQRHYAQIAQRLFELARGDGVRGIVLAGMGADANAVQPHLHPYLSKEVIGVTKLNPKTATPAEVMEAVLVARSESERTWEGEHIRALEEGLGKRWSVNGVEATLAALGRGQVRTLLVDPTTEQAGYRCVQTGMLSTNPGRCGDTVPEPVPDVIDEAIEEALRQHAHVDVIEDETARRKVSGLAALLRFKLG